MPASGSMCSAVRSSWRPVVAECAATALLVLLGCMTLANPGSGDGGLLRPALGFGAIIAGLVAVFGEISGAHMNPAVTLAALVMGRVKPALAVAYCAAQCVGATLGYGAMVLCSADKSSELACTIPVISNVQAMLVEAAMTALLALLCCAAWCGQGGHDHTMPLKFGTLVTGLVLAGGPMSGASLNPARSLGPALLTGCWRDHWVYWCGPLLGSGLAAFMYRIIFVKTNTEEPNPEDLPLRTAKGEDC